MDDAWNGLLLVVGDCCRHGDWPVGGALGRELSSVHSRQPFLDRDDYRQIMADLKPPQAAVAKYHGGERLRKRWGKIPAGMDEGGERKQTADEAVVGDLS